MVMCFYRLYNERTLIPESQVIIIYCTTLGITVRSQKGPAQSILVPNKAVLLLRNIFVLPVLLYLFDVCQSRWLSVKVVQSSSFFDILLFYLSDYILVICLIFIHFFSGICYAFQRVYFSCLNTLADS